MLGVGRDCVCCVLGGEQVEVYILQQSDRFLLWLSKQYKKMPEIVEAETLAEQFIALGLDKSIEVCNTMPLHTGLDPSQMYTV